MNEQQLNEKFQEFERQIIHLQDQLSVLNQAIEDMKSVSEGIVNLKGSIGKDIMAPIGRGIFVKAKLSSESLIVDLGAGNFVEKSIDQARELIKQQQIKIEKTRLQTQKDLEKINQQITETMKQFQSNNSK